MAEGSEQAAARAENLEAFKVEGFKERGGILRVEEDAKESADVKSASARSTPLICFATGICHRPT